MRNLFAGMITDATLGLPMQYYWKGEQLVTDSYRLKIRPNRIDYVAFESAFLRFLDQISWDEILDVAESAELVQVEAEIAKLAAEIDHGEQRASNLAALYEDTPSRTLRERLLTAEAATDAARGSLDAARARLEALRAQNRELLSDDVVYTKLSTASDLQTRSRLREEIRKKVARIDFRFEDGLIMTVIEFINGATRFLQFNGSELVAVIAEEPAGEDGWASGVIQSKGLSHDEIIRLLETRRK